MRRHAWLVLPMSLSACGLLLGNDDLSGTGPASTSPEAGADGASGSDGSPTPDDGTVPDDHSTTNIDAAEPCTNLLLNGGFEDKASCDPWFSALDDGSVQISSVAHSGVRACQMCAGPNGLNIATPLSNTSWSPGDTLVFTGWVRAADDALFATPIIPTVGDNTYQSQINRLMSKDYERFSMKLEYPEDAGTIVTPYIRWLGGSNGCILVDDLSVCRQ